MTWSTRTAVQCTSAPSQPDCAAPMHRLTPGAPLSWSHRVGPSPSRAPRASSCAITSPSALRRHRRRAALLVGLRALGLLRGARRPDRPHVSRGGRPRCPEPGLGAADPVVRVRALPADSTNVRIAMTENDGIDVIVGVVGRRVGAGRARLARRAVPADGRGRGPSTPGPGCAGPWTQVLANQTTPTASPVSGGLLQLCVAGGEPDRPRHAERRSTTRAARRRTVNTLPLETYVADTVPGESPSSWASVGGAGPQGMDWGFQELEAQAVAVRSYVLADLGGYGGYADTCDLTVRPTAAPSTRRRRASPPPTTPPGR